MAYKNLSAELADADVQAIKSSLAAIRKKLPFLITLAPDERKQLFKMGDKSLAFVENSLLAAKNNPDVLPASFEVAEYEKDVRLAVSLSEVATAIAQLASDVDDTRMAVSSEAIGASTDVYNYVKTAAKPTPGLKPVAEQLSARFTKTAKPAVQPPAKAA